MEGASIVRSILIYPNREEVAASNLGFHVVAETLRRHPAFRLETATMPPRGSRNWPRLTGKNLVLFSVSFEEDYANLMTLLSRGGISPLANERRRGDPLVVIGGVAPTLNPEPLAPAADLIFLGESEAGLPGLLDLLSQAGPFHVSRKGDLLREAADLPGVYVPSLYRVETDSGGRLISREALGGAPDRIPAVHSDSLDETWVAHLDESPVSPFRGTYLVETGRGCPGTCRFCAARQAYHPLRWRDLSPLGERIPSGATRLGLVGTAVSDHPQIMQALETAHSLRLRAGVSSLRLGHIPRDLPGTLAATGERSVALAPEAGNEELRRRMGKRLRNETITRDVELLASSGLTRIRLYFLMGVPGERKEDARSLVELVGELQSAARRAAPRGRPSRLMLSVNPFVPKPLTPWEGEPFAGRRRLDRAEKEMAVELRRLGIACKFGSPRRGELQALLSRGDRRVGLALALRETDGVTWREALAREGVDPEAHLGDRRGVRGLPWRWN